MPIFNYNDTNGGLLQAIHDAGHNVREVDGVMTSTNDVAVQAIIDSYDALPYAKKLKVDELKTEGLSRVQGVFPAIGDFDELDLIRETYLSIVPAARSATTDFQNMINIVQAGKAAATDINALTTVAEVEAYDVVNTPAWPVI